MSDHRQQARRAWAKFLDPEVLRSNLIVASIFLAAYETQGGRDYFVVPAAKQQEAAQINVIAVDAALNLAASCRFATRTTSCPGHL